MEQSLAMRNISTSKPNASSDNKVRNTKYNIFTFIPYVLFLQFRSFSSIYFFVLMALQLFPQFAISSFTTSVLPWLFVFVMALINEGIDDYKRHLRDRESNSSRSSLWTPSAFKSVTSANIKTGDIILIKKNERVPADCVILKVDDASGEVFIRTDQLDGETDWKRRIAPAETQFCSLDALSDIRLTVENPHKDVYSFTGTLDIQVSKTLDNSAIFVKESNPAVPDLLNIENEADNTTPKVQVDGKDSKDNKDDKDSKDDRDSKDYKDSKDDKTEMDDIKDITDNNNADNSITDNDNNNNADKNINENEAFKKPERISIGIDLENTMWANTVVATNDVLGVVIYTGHDTRSMMNTSQPRSKIGKFERELDRAIIVLSIISCAAAAGFTVAYIRNFFRAYTIIAFVHYLILFSYVIPISLKVTINLARIWYVMSIQSRPELRGVIVRTSSIQEELGRVSFLLTDKTGTLTRNEMVMKKLHLGTICYNVENTPDICEILQEVEMRTKRRKTLFRKSKHLGMRVYELAEALSLCHSVMPVETENGIIYQASSPDEQAIVEYAERIGFKLVKRDRVHVVIRTYTGEKTYRILQTFPFNSDTKRMGIILEKEENGEILFFEKGADTAMKLILKENDWAEEETDNMARDGLRTLLIGKKVLTREEYSEFAEAYNAAKLTVTNRNECMLKQQMSIEHGLDLLGLTGVEDRLQDRVKQSLENLRNAGIRIWMLTGDKIETAISIALSSKLLEKTDRYLIISKCTSAKEMEQHLRMLKSKRYNSLVIDGQSLVIVIEKYLKEFIATVKNLSCLVGCRYTPTQKATMASALREMDQEVVCCIGDGGNDVSMITQADVGVGIEGREGNQASLAADFSIRTFSDVCDLFFWHGRRCYKNSSSVAHMIIHRGTMSSLIQALFSALLLFTPFSFMQGLTPILFIFYTFFPLFGIIASTDISRHAALKFPELYHELRNSHLLSAYSFLMHSTNSLYQALVIILWFQNRFREIQNFRMLVFAALIFNEQIMVLLSLERITLFAVGMCLLSVSLYFISFFLFPNDLFSESFHNEYWNVFIACLLASILALAAKMYSRWIKPASHRKLGLSA